MIPIAKPIVGEEELSNVREVLLSGQLAQGKWVKDFEDQFASKFQIKNAVAVTNGTLALDLALKALNIKPGDEVIVPAFTFIATANAVLYQGAKPVFVDVDPKTFNVDPNEVRKKITPKTKAIIAVHLFGQSADLKSLMEISNEHSVHVVEDSAQAHGTKFNGKYVGGFGIGTFSFYATKNMMTGEGGMITTNDDQLASRMRLLRDHGQSEKYLHTELGYNFRMTNIMGAVGQAQLKKLEGWNQKRAENAAYLNQRLNNLSGISTPYLAEYSNHTYHQYVIKIEERIGRDAFKDKLAEKGVGSAIHYPIPLHQQPLYKKLGYSEEKYPISESLAKSVLSLPVHPALNNDDLKKIADSVEEILGGQQ